MPRNGVNHEENRDTIRNTERLPPKFAGFIMVVLKEQCVWIVKNMYRAGKGNAMLLQVLPRLDRVPFEPDRHSFIVTPIL